MKKILVTGGLGYIGSHTVLKVIEDGYIPIILDNLSNSEINVLSRLEKLTGKTIEFYESSLANQELLDGLFGDHEINSVIPINITARINNKNNISPE